MADIACIITAYGNAEIAVEQVNSLIAQLYPKQLFQIYVVADNCNNRPKFNETTEVTLIYPENALHSKIKSIKLAIEHFVRNHTHILVLDADNLLHKEVLMRLNNYLVQGFKAVQGQRTAKNLDTHIAALDSLSEYYYNVSQRWAPFTIGSSATIAGSGMVIDAPFFKRYVSTLLGENGNQIILAEDKLLQMMLVEENKRIAYCKEALIFDEKVREGAQVQRQRTRWLRSWFDHWGQAIGIAIRGLTKGNWNQLYFGLMLSVPPMVMLVAGLLLSLIAGILINSMVLFLSIIGLGFFFTGFVTALLIAPAPKIIWQSIPFIPVFVIRQILAILKIKASNKDFMATTHSQYLTIDEVWNQRKADFPYMTQENKML
ncbi:MAG: glycosyltransferase family 2 protein [Sediminibacterium sp.]|nr:glycosyltransferase family 2 protein [Sediminibacterium sp.]